MSIGASVTLPISTTGTPALWSSRRVASVWVVPVRKRASACRARKASDQLLLVLQRKIRRAEEQMKAGRPHHLAHRLHHLGMQGMVDRRNQRRHHPGAGGGERAGDQVGQVAQLGDRRRHPAAGRLGHGLRGVQHARDRDRRDAGPGSDLGHPNAPRPLAGPRRHRPFRLPERALAPCSRRRRQVSIGMLALPSLPRDGPTTDRGDQGRHGGGQPNGPA